ncbi:hypothetical protein QYF36_007862 [Acer negundo]|nr:hypothetical protein QYF36_007862 [Acer negundo]
MEGLKHEIAIVRKSLFDEELLNDNYKEIEQLEDDDNPGFLEEVFDSFWSNSTQLLASIEEDMYKTPPDYISMDKNLHQLKGSSASVGANKIRITVDILRECLKEGNLEM